MFLDLSPIPNHPSSGQVLFIEDGDEDFPDEVIVTAPFILDNEGHLLFFVVFPNSPKWVHDFTEKALRVSLLEIRNQKKHH